MSGYAPYFFDRLSLTLLALAFGSKGGCLLGPWFLRQHRRPNNSFKPNPLRGFVLNSSQFVALSPSGSSRSGSA